jgi:O-antigen/teichoic acid export membrane protein
LIAATFGAEAIGIYASAYSLARLIREIFVPINTALLPLVSREWDRENYDQARWVLSNTVHYYLLISIPALIGLSLVGSDLLTILATEQIAQATTVLIPVLGLGLLLSSLQNAYAALLQLAERTGALAVSKLMSASIYLGAIFISVPRWGLLGGAAATVIAYGLDLLFAGIFSARHGRIFPSLLSPAKSVLAAAAIIPVVRTMPVNSGWWIAVNVFLGVVVYCLVLLLLGGIGKRETDFVKNLVQNIRTPKEQ